MRFKGADAYLTADLKYHQFYEAENQLTADIDILKVNAIQKIILLSIFGKILNFAVILSEENSNQLSTYRICEYERIKC
jgi:putative NIF3 family GTP cyclohydrolase 1 type 2